MLCIVLNPIVSLHITIYAAFYFFIFSNLLIFRLSHSLGFLLLWPPCPTDHPCNTTTFFQHKCIHAQAHESTQVCTHRLIREVWSPLSYLIFLPHSPYHHLSYYAFICLQTFISYCSAMRFTRTGTWFYSSLNPQSLRQHSTFSRYSTSFIWMNE